MLRVSRSVHLANTAAIHGNGNTKNGNKYLAWGFVEAANFAIRFSSRIKSFYQKKKSKSHAIVAIKAVAHKLCRACYYIVKDPLRKGVLFSSIAPS
jgi:transposase